MKIPWRQYLLWLVLALWFALGVSGLPTNVERENYAQTRALAHGTTNLAPYLAPPNAGAANPATARRRPGVAVCALPFYVLGRVIGRTQNDDPAHPRGLAAQVTSLAAAAAAATAVLLLGLCGWSLGLRTRSSIAMAFLIAAASPVWAYGARLASPAFGLLAISLMLYALLRIEAKDRRVSLRFLLGAGLGLSLLLGDEQFVTLPLFLLWTLAHVRRIVGRPGYALAFLLPLSILGLLFAWYNETAWGGWWNAPSGAPLWTYLRGEYWSPALLAQSTSRYVWSGLHFFLFSDGPMPMSMALARELPAPLREVIFYGVFIWCPLLFVGVLGAWALLRDPDAGGTTRLLLIAFFIAVGMRAVARTVTPISGYDAGDTLPFWIAWWMGLGFFAEVHLFSMRVGLIRLILLAGFLFVATISLANAAHEAVLSRVGEPTNISPLGLAAAGAPNSLKSLLPGGGRDAFFQPLKQVASWTASPPKLIAALWPGLNHWLLFLLILAPIGLIPPAVGLLFRWHLTRGAVEEAEGKVDRPPATEEQKPPPAAGEADDTKPAES